MTCPSLQGWARLILQEPALGTEHPALGLRRHSQPLRLGLPSCFRPPRDKSTAERGSLPASLSAGEDDTKGHSIHSPLATTGSIAADGDSITSNSFGLFFNKSMPEAGQRINRIGHNDFELKFQIDEVAGVCNLWS